MSEQTPGAPSESVESPQIESQEAVDSQQAAPEAPKPEPTKAEVKKEEKLLKRLKLKVDGREFEEDFDLGDEANVTRTVQLAKMAQKRAQEKSEMEKSIGQLLDLARKNPRKFFEDPAIGLDVKQFVNSYVEEELARAAMTPEQIEKQKLVQELEELKSARVREQEEARGKEQERLIQQAIEKYDNQISTALSSHELPQNPEVVTLFADYLDLGLRNGVELTADDIAPLVKKQLMGNLQSAIDNMDLDEVENFLGKERISKLRKKNIAQIKAAASTAPNGIAKDVGAPVAAPKKPDSPLKGKSFSDLLKM